MQEKGFWELLQQNNREMTKSGRIVAEYLQHHAEQAQYLSMAALAKACGVAEATVFRFCRALGFNGYNEMKIALAKANVTPGAPQPNRLEAGMTTAMLCDYALSVANEAIQNTRALLDPDKIDQAATMLQRARQVYCFGQGGNMALAEDVWGRFATISNKFRIVTDDHMQIITASLLGPEDVILFFSYSGATRDMVDTLQVAKQYGAKVILFTHYADSPGAALSDIVLLCGEQESPLDTGSIPVKIAILMVADVLILRYSLDNQELTAISQQRTSEALAVKLL